LLSPTLAIHACRGWVMSSGLSLQLGKNENVKELLTSDWLLTLRAKKKKLIGPNLRSVLSDNKSDTRLRHNSQDTSVG
jgi:hypothetical protein